jgi:hypothetical protein
MERKLQGAPASHEAGYEQSSPAFVARFVRSGIGRDTDEGPKAWSAPEKSYFE